MKKIPITFSLIIYLFLAAAASQDKPDGKSPCQSVNGTQAEANACALLKYRQAAAEMKRLYKRLVSELSKSSDNGELKQKLEQAQSLWLLYRDTHCESEALIYLGGSLRPAIYKSCLASITEERTERMKMFLAAIKQ